MNSIGHSCNDLKHQYDECFLTWFTNHFMKGKISDDVCEPLFKIYQECIQSESKFRSHRLRYPMEACQQLKDKYDDCFNLWFSQKFLKGDTDDSMCAELLKVYKACVEKTMKENHIDVKDAEINYLGTDKEFKPPLRDKKAT